MQLYSGLKNWLQQVNIITYYEFSIEKCNFDILKYERHPIEILEDT